MKKRWLTTILIIAVTAFISSCDHEGGYPTSINSPVEETTISSMSINGGSSELRATNLLGRAQGLVLPLVGGTIPLLDSRFEAPPLAVSLPTLVTWDIFAQTPAGLASALPRVYNFYPHLLIFLVPTTVSVSFANAGLGANNPDEYTFYYFNQGSGEWEPQPTTVDIENQRFIVTLHHFSRYAFAR